MHVLLLLRACVRVCVCERERVCAPAGLRTHLGCNLQQVPGPGHAIVTKGLRIAAKA